MKTYNVRAKRWAKGWELHIEDLGVTQSHSLADAEMMVRDYIALDRKVPRESFDVAIVPQIDTTIDREIQAARRAVREAQQAQHRAAEESRDVVRALKSRGITGRDTAAVLGVSPQRVSQLLADAGRPGDRVAVTGAAASRGHRAATRKAQARKIPVKTVAAKTTAARSAAAKSTRRSK